MCHFLCFCVVYLLLGWDRNAIMRWLLAAALVAMVHGQELETCLSADDDPYVLFGTKTAYSFRGGPTSRIQDVSGCEPIAFWLVNRHGSTNPDAGEIPELQRLEDLKQNILSNYQNGNFRNTNSRMCQADVSLLERWEYNPRQNVSFANDLTSEGYITTQQLAQSWKQKFPTLLGDNRLDYMFKYINERKSHTMFKAFTEGLFRALAESYGIPNEADDKLLAPYKFCPTWTKDVEQNNDTMEQVKIFENKQEYKEMTSAISRRLGFNYDVDAATVRNMYQMCRYNKAWDVSKISAWCSVFTKEDLQRLEYAEDLETFYKYGYGAPASQRFGCTLVKNMVDFFTHHIRHADTPQQPKVLINFAEAPMIMMMLTALGAHRTPTPLTGDNFRTPQMQGRKWTSSNMAPYNANLAAVLYKCSQSSYTYSPVGTGQYQVLFLENGHEMNLEECRVGLCNWPVVEQRYGNVAKNCDLKFCNDANYLNGVYGVWLAVIAFVFRYFF